MCPVCPSSRAKGNAGKNCRRKYGRCKGDTSALSVVRLGFLLMLAAGRGITSLERSRGPVTLV